MVAGAHDVAPVLAVEAEEALDLPFDHRRVSALEEVVLVHASDEGERRMQVGVDLPGSSVGIDVPAHSSRGQGFGGVCTSPTPSRAPN